MKRIAFSLGITLELALIITSILPPHVTSFVKQRSEVKGQMERKVIAEVQPFTLIIEAERQSFILGEPVIMTGLLTNRTSEPKTLYRDNYFFKIYLSTDGKNFRRLQDEVLMRRIWIDEVLQPGQTWQFHKVVIRDFETRSKLAIDQPGQVYIKAEYWGYSTSGYYDKTGWPDFPRSEDALRIFVQSPSGTDAEVFELVRDKDSTFDSYTHLMYYGSLGDERKDKDGVEKFYRISQDYPESTYAPILRRGLIRNFEQQQKEINRAFSEKEKRMYESLQQQRPRN